MDVEALTRIEARNALLRCVKEAPAVALAARHEGGIRRHELHVGRRKDVGPVDVRHASPMTRPRCVCTRLYAFVRVGRAAVRQTAQLGVPAPDRSYTVRHWDRSQSRGRIEGSLLACFCRPPVRSVSYRRHSRAGSGEAIIKISDVTDGGQHLQREGLPRRFGAHRGHAGQERVTHFRLHTLTPVQNLPPG